LAQAPKEFRPWNLARFNLTEVPFYEQIVVLLLFIPHKTGFKDGRKVDKYPDMFLVFKPQKLTRPSPVDDAERSENNLGDWPGSWRGQKFAWTKKFPKGGSQGSHSPRFWVQSIGETKVLSDRVSTLALSSDMEAAQRGLDTSLNSNAAYF